MAARTPWRTKAARACCLAVAAALAFAGPGCRRDAEAEEAAETARFATALPTEGLLLFELPGAPAVTETSASLPLVGGASDLHALNLLSFTKVNRALRAMLRPIDRITASPPVIRAEGQRVWRLDLPARDHVLALSVERRADGHFRYSLWARVRGSGDPWRFVLGGTRTPADGDGEGRGTVQIDFDNDDDPATSGVVEALWSEIDGRREVVVSFFGATPDEASFPRQRAGFQFVSEATGGVMAMDLGQLDVDDDPERTDLERVRLVSRWRDDGRGRTDVSASGGDVAADDYGVLLKSQCWQAPGLRVSYEATFAARAGETRLVPLTAAGDLERCAFEAPMVPIVPEPTEPQPQPRQPPGL